MLIDGQSQQRKLVKKGFLFFRVSFVVLLNAYGSGQLFCQFHLRLLVNGRNKNGHTFCWESVAWL